MLFTLHICEKYFQILGNRKNKTIMFTIWLGGERSHQQTFLNDNLQGINYNSKHYVHCANVSSVMKSISNGLGVTVQEHVSTGLASNSKAGDETTADY